MKLQYNSPVILTYALISAMVMFGTMVFGVGFQSLFVLNGNFRFGVPLDYFRLVSYVAGHADWGHLLGNFALILVVGPILEEKYTSKVLLQMIAITALATAVINIILFRDNILGASGVVFMLILLSSFSSFKKGHIPLTFVLVFCLYVGKEISSSFAADQISQYAHIMGGICGAFFGFMGQGAGKQKGTLEL